MSMSIQSSTHYVCNERWGCVSDHCLYIYTYIFTYTQIYTNTMLHTVQQIQLEMVDISVPPPWWDVVPIVNDCV
jgi:hypothetical protein